MERSRKKIYFEKTYFEPIEPVHILIMRYKRQRKPKRKIMDFWST